MRAQVDPAALDALFAPFDRNDAPGFAVGIALEGRPVYQHGFGLASIELPVPLSPGIRMRIGSTSKHFTALALMLLAEEGRLSLDDSPRRHLPELQGWTEAITLRQLLAHSSGMRDSMDLILHSTDPATPVPPDFQLKLLATIDSANFAPGLSWNYSNGGYVLLSEIVARASGQPFADFLKERIFAPVGMHDTMLRPLDDELLPNSATLHIPTPGGGWRRGRFGGPIMGEGGIVSTVDDMLLWLRHMSEPVVGTRASWAEMRTPLSTHGYGLGLFMSGHRGLDTIHHGGAVFGGASQMLKVLDHELDIVLMTNGRSSLDVHNLLYDCLDRCFPGLPPAPQTMAGTPMGGRYHSAATGRTLSLVPLGAHQAIRIGPATLPVVRDGNGALAVPLLPSDMRVMPIGDGDAVELVEFGVADRLVRIEAPANADAVSLAGRYECPTAGLIATIAEDATLDMQGPLGNLAYALQPIGRDLWEARSVGTMPLAATFEFDVEGFRFTTGRTVRLRFARSS